MANNTTTKKTTTNKKNTQRKNNNAEKKAIKSKKVQTVNIQKHEQKDSNNTFLTVIGIIILVIVAIIIFRLTYAFFTLHIDDRNPDIIDTQILTADLEVEYKDDGKIVSKKIEPGNTINKEFEVTNNGNDLGIFAIVLQKYENTFNVVCPTEEEPNNGELVFHLYKFNLDEFGNKTEEKSLLSTGILPCGIASEVSLYSKDSVGVNSTNYYFLDIEYKNLNIDQSDNMDEGKLETLINITDTKEQFTDSNKPTAN